MRTAVFGGTFDPIHNAHLAIARAAAARCALDRVIFVPASNPPHKPHGAAASFEHRLAMVRLACEDDLLFGVSGIESGPGKSYSIHTIEKLQPGFFIIGADAFAEIGTWHRWRDVVRAVEFIVVTRPGHDYQPPPGARVSALEGLDLRVSSSDVRRQLAAGEAPGEVPPRVLAYIRAHNLYSQSRVAG